MSRPKIKIGDKQPSAGSTFLCPSCNAKTIGLFCGNCGEKEVTAQDYSVQHYGREIVAAATLLESKVFRSIWLVLTRPGYLSSEYFRGRRVRYMKPLQLFVFVNVLYYFSLTLFSATTFTTPLTTQLHGNNYYPGYASTRVERKLQKEKISYQELELKYNAKTGVLSKTFIFLLIPIFALLFYVLFFKKRKYLAEHVVGATHFWAFHLLLLGVIVPIATITLLRIFRALNIPAAFVTNDGITSTFIQICIAVYLFIMLRGFYASSKVYGALAASLIAWSFFHMIWLYRFLLFEITLSSV